MTTRKRFLLWGFVVTIIVSFVFFIAYNGYFGMFDSFMTEDTVEVVKTTSDVVVDPITGSNLVVNTDIDTITVYRLIIGSFESLENAELLSKQYPYSDILPITEDGYYRVSLEYFFTLEDARKAEEKYGNEKSWIYFGNILIPN